MGMIDEALDAVDGCSSHIASLCCPGGVGGNQAIRSMISKWGGMMEAFTAEIAQPCEAKR